MSKSVGADFWLGTQYEHMAPPPQASGVPAPPVVLAADQGAPVVSLPDPRAWSPPPLNLHALVTSRRTHRAYKADPLGIAELSWLLWCAQGVEKTMDDGRTMRTVPSAGARHAFETFLLVNAVDTLEPGLYRFIAPTHQLARRAADADRIEALTDAFRNVNLVRLSAVVFIWVAVAPRMTWKFGERGYRYLLLDAGHACQNLYLSAEAIGCGTCAIGAFNDADMNAALGLDGVNQFVTYAASTGRKP